MKSKLAWLWVVGLAIAGCAFWFFAWVTLLRPQAKTAPSATPSNAPQIQWAQTARPLSTLPLQPAEATQPTGALIWQDYVHISHAFSLRHPQTWQVQAEETQSVFTDTENALTLVVRFLPNPEQTDLQALAVRLAETQASSLPQFTLGKYWLAEVPMQEYFWQSDSYGQMHCMVFIYAVRAVVFTRTFCLPDNRLAGLYPVITDVLQSFQVDEGAAQQVLSGLSPSGLPSGELQP
ncbi:MAG TPA: hypothetical protein PK299_15315 [Anaerolineales bacterium]|nr:hypothetical protein [Anaerolineales bacterium]